jgi:hypothetical protein
LTFRLHVWHVSLSVCRLDGSHGTKQALSPKPITPANAGIPPVETMR